MDTKNSPGKVCVTGAAGFLASWLVKRLLERGYHVTGTVRDPGDYRKIGHLWELEGAKERLHLVRAELMEDGSFDSAIMGCQGVFHTAFPVLYPTSDPKAEVLDPAVEGTLNVLRSWKKNPTLKKVVLTSSVAVVSRPSATPEEPIDESMWSDAQHCENIKQLFALGKLLSDKMAFDYAKENGFTLVSVNPSFIIGPSLSKNLHLTAEETLALLKGDTRGFFQLERMGYVHVDDVANCHIAVYESDAAEGRYICSSVVLEAPELASILTKRYPWLSISSQFDDNYVQRPHFEYNNSKVKQLGIKFKGIEEMFDDCIQSLKQQGHLP